VVKKLHHLLMINLLEEKILLHLTNSPLVVETKVDLMLKLELMGMKFLLREVLII
jgi:hypothetical protein